MAHDPDSKFRRAFTPQQLKGRHHLTLTPAELNEAFLAECERERRVPSDLIRIILEDRYAQQERVRRPHGVDIRPQHAVPGKRDVA